MANEAKGEKRILDVYSLSRIIKLLRLARPPISLKTVYDPNSKCTFSKFERVFYITSGGIDEVISHATTDIALENFHFPFRLILTKCLSFCMD